MPTTPKNMVFSYIINNLVKIKLDEDKKYMKIIEIDEI